MTAVEAVLPLIQLQMRIRADLHRERPNGPAESDFLGNDHSQGAGANRRWQS
jgi:hypothetical protein